MSFHLSLHSFITCLRRNWNRICARVWCSKTLAATSSRKRNHSPLCNKAMRAPPAPHSINPLQATMRPRAQPLIARLPGPFHPARWIIEEWRVALFAQELKAQGAPNAEKIIAAL